MSAGLGNGFGLQAIRVPGDIRASDWHVMDLTDASVPANITFSRASTRTYFDVNGVLQYATTDVWPLEFDPATGLCLGRSVWAAATNLLLRSEEFDNAAWTKNRCSVTANTTVSPDGATTTDTFTATSTDANGMTCMSTPLTFSGSTLTLSWFAKKGTGDYLIANVFDGGANGARHWFNLATGAVGSSNTFGTGWSKAAASIVDCGGGFYRCIFSVNTTGTNARAVIYPSTPSDLAYSCATGDVGYIWGAQCEAGSIATPYIPTVAGTVTRAADSARVLDLNTVGYNSNEGTIVVDCITTAPAPAPTTTTRRLVAFSDGTLNEQIRIYWDIDTKLYAGARDGGSTVVIIDTGVPTSGARVRISYGYALNDHAASRAGNAVVTDVTGTVPTPNALWIGWDGTTANNQWQGIISNITYIPRKVSNTELTGLSTL